MRFAELLKQMRKGANLSGPDLAEKLSVSTTYVFAVEKGDRVLNYPALVRWMRAFRCQLTPEIVLSWLQSYGTAALAVGREGWRQRLLALLVLLWPVLTEEMAAPIEATLLEIHRLRSP
jgi:transcriptional regulator with XRE-family HTH domain